MDFTKMQSAGNDYVLVVTDDTQRDWSQWALTVCDRHFGIGADSLLVLLPSAEADFRMRIFDADGSEAETCGNGLRCLAKYIYQKGLVSAGTDRILIETIAGTREVTLYLQGGRLIRIQANMGKPAFRAEDIPVVIESGEGKVVDIKSMLSYPVTVGRNELRLNLVSMGNPHAVYFWEHPVADFPLAELGPEVENLEIFPNRINFEVARVVSRQQIEVRTWERGVGETLACGSGACAVAVAARLHGYIESRVDVEVRGGMLQVEWDGADEVLLSGPAEIVFEGEWPDEPDEV